MMNNNLGTPLSLKRDTTKLNWGRSKIQFYYVPNRQNIEKGLQLYNIGNCETN